MPLEIKGMSSILEDIRPGWQTKNLINRVHRLLSVDPSSACQRLLNAAIHDLRDKLIIAGTDIAAEVAKQNKLPPIGSEEDIENYPTAKLIDLSYRIGLLSRSAWRRLSRCYEIRRDLEHEDDEYEAGIEDCVYIFKTCIEEVLSKDPIRLIKVSDIKTIIEEATAASPDEECLEDYESAPPLRQENVLKFLISKALDASESEIIQSNAYRFITYLRPITQSAAVTKVARSMLENVKRPMDKRTARIAVAAGVFPYLRRSVRIDFFRRVHEEMERVGHRWTSHENHGKLLRSFIEVEGLKYCADEILDSILEWLVRAYIGEPGGVTSYGHVRNVYFSDTAAPLIKEIIKSGGANIGDNLEQLRENRSIKICLANKHVQRRFEELLDFTE